MEVMCAVGDRLIYWITSGLRRRELPARLEYAKIPAVNLLPAQFYVSGNGEDLER